jgi:hypothetical protein
MIFDNRLKINYESVVLDNRTTGCVICDVPSQIYFIDYIFSLI